MKKYHVVLLLIPITLFACGVQGNYPTPFKVDTEFATLKCPEVVSTPGRMPIFLEWVYPSGNISKAEYDESVADGEGVQATISALGLDESVSESIDSSERGEIMQNRVQLLVDGELIDSGPTNLWDGLMPLGPFYFNWAIKLDLGYHTAILIFHIDTDEIMNYEWSFCIIP